MCNALKGIHTLGLFLVVVVTSHAKNGSDINAFILGINWIILMKVISIWSLWC